MKARIVRVIMALALAISPALVLGRQTLILEHAHVVDPINDRPPHDQIIVLKNGRIQSISSSPATLPGE